MDFQSMLVEDLTTYFSTVSFRILYSSTTSGVRDETKLLAVHSCKLVLAAPEETS